MPPRRGPRYTQEDIERQLQQILFDPSSSSEGLEQLGPIIKQIHHERQQDAYLRTLQVVINAKNAEIERICSDTYQDVLPAIAALFAIQSYSNDLRDKVTTTLDISVFQVARASVERKRKLVQAKRALANLDEAIDNLQAGVRVLNTLTSIGGMIQQRKYWSALRSIDDIQYMPAGLPAQAPLYHHTLTCLPSLREQIKSAVLAQNTQWLLDIRNLTKYVGRLALGSMRARSNKWKVRRERDPLLQRAQVGSAAETVMYENHGHNVLESDELQVDFKPLYQSIHVYTALGSLDELRRWYRESRSGQSELILQASMQLSSFTDVVEGIIGFFIIESHVLRTTSNFRSPRDVEELWDTSMQRFASVVKTALEKETDAASFLHVKEVLLDFVIAAESYAYSTQSMHMLLQHLFEKYVTSLERRYGKRSEEIIQKDDLQPFTVKDAGKLEDALRSIWLAEHKRDALSRSAFPAHLPWSNSFPLCCASIRDFAHRSHQFIEGVPLRHHSVDELLGKSLDVLLKEHLATSFIHQLERTTQLPDLAQIIANLEHFEGACAELEHSLNVMREAQRGDTVRITAAPAFAEALTRARARLADVITSELDGFFELNSYEWTPAQKEEVPSIYLTKLVAWLSTAVDSLQLKGEDKEQLYQEAVAHIAHRLMEFLTDETIPMMNENGVTQISTDVGFLETVFDDLGHEDLNHSFAEIQSTITLALSDTVAEVLVPAARKWKHSHVDPKHLQVMLGKLSKYGATLRDPVQRARADRRRREAEQIGRMLSGEGS
ncbi:unnamed protein product [Peniophora sp. CBMAI 1063]|nr:unnamed protein product [Peniophora sp. CBMAI 1063]